MTSADTTTGWGWYAGSNGETYTIGPLPTRDAVIAAAIHDGGFCDDDGDGPLNSFYIVEARQDPLRLADWIGTDTLLERADESVLDSDRALYEHDEGPFFEVKPDQEADLIARIKATCDAWQADLGLTFTCRTFSASRGEEFVNIPAEAPR